MQDVREDFRIQGQQFEIYWKTQLHGWLAGRKSVAGTEIGAVLLRLSEFCQLVRDETFEVAVQRTLVERVPGTILELNEKLAHRFCRGLRGTERFVASKSIQEAFLYATGIQHDLPLSTFGRKLGAFLRQRGSCGMISLFLRLLVFNEISMSPQIPLQGGAPDIHSLEAALRELERLCSSAVDTVHGEHSTWPKLNRNLAINLMNSLESQIRGVARHSVA